MTPSIAALWMLLATATIVDLRSRRIPNLLSAFGLGLAFALAFAAHGASGLWTSLQGLLLAFAIFLPAFLLRAVGAGDVKLMMVVGGMVGVDGLVPISAIALAASGGIAIAASVATGRTGELLVGLKTTVYALASRDLDGAAAIAGRTQYRVPFALAVLIGAGAWHVMPKA
jgi:prepilin peptidase CpaA